MPISPDQLKTGIPKTVFDAFDALIKKHWSGRSAMFNQSEVISLLEEKGITAEEVRANKWLYVEEEYRKLGWQAKSYVRGHAIDPRDPVYIFRAP